MILTASALVLAAALSSNVSDAPAVGPHQPLPAPLAAAAARAGESGARTIRVDGAAPRWLTDTRDARPKLLPAMYATLGALQALDVYSTRRAVSAGARELNPIVEKATGSSGTMLAMKALSSAGSIYFAERAWKKNRKGAVVLMAAINGVTAAVVANNLKNAR